MAYSFSFADNVTYAASDVNAITKRLVSGGVADPFSDGTPYNLTQFNETGMLLYSSGVVAEDVLTLKVTVSGNEATINPGTAFFSDGATITIEAGGHKLGLVEGAVNYVYLKNDLVASNECYPTVSTEEPTGIYVMLAEVSGGTVTDKRVYAMGKVAGYASCANYTMLIQDTVEVKNGAIQDKVYRIGDSGYRMLVAQYSEERGDTGGGSAVVSTYNFADSSYLSVGYAGGDGWRYDDRLEVWRKNDTSIYVKVTEAEAQGVKQITLAFTYNSHGSSAEPPNSFPITLYLF